MRQQFSDIPPWMTAACNFCAQAIATCVEVCRETVSLDTRTPLFVGTMIARIFIAAAKQWRHTGLKRSADLAPLTIFST
jgi:hypothetical protein